MDVAFLSSVSSRAANAFSDASNHARNTGKATKITLSSGAVSDLKESTGYSRKLATTAKIIETGPAPFLVITGPLAGVKALIDRAGLSPDAKALRREIEHSWNNHKVSFAVVGSDDVNLLTKAREDYERLSSPVDVVAFPPESPVEQYGERFYRLVI